MSNQVILTREQLEAMSGPELVQVFNAIPGTKPVKKFSSRGSGVNRILSVQEVTLQEPKAKRPASTDPEDLSGPTVSKSKEPAKKTGRARTPRGTYDMQADATKQSLRKMRESSGKGQLRDALAAGATWEELLSSEAFSGWGEKKLHYTIRSLSWWHGYALRTSPEGIITVENA